MRSWLCIAYAFPPINRSGTHRTTAFVRGLDRLGWKGTVLTVAPPTGESLDPQLMQKLPAGIEIVRAPWCRPIQDFRRGLPSFRKAGGLTCDGLPGGQKRTPGSIGRFLRALASLFAIPDSRTGWIVPAVWRGLGAVRRCKPQVIFSTSPYASAHLIGLVLSRLTNTPWVADFRDPWCGNPFESSKPDFIRHWEKFLESIVLRHVSAITSATDTIVAQLIARHPEIRTKVHTILNGADADLLEKILPRRLGSDDKFIVAHCGQFYGPREPSTLLHALRLLVQSPAHSAKVRLALIGPTRFQGRHLLQYAAEAGVGDKVIICGERTHAEALSLAGGANALLLLGASGAGGDLQVPQKLFEYLALRKPILALISNRNPAVEILRAARADAIVCDPSDARAAAEALARLADPGHTAPHLDWSGVGQFDREHRVNQLHSIFEQLTVRPHRAAPRATGSGATVALDEMAFPSMMPA